MMSVSAFAKLCQVSRIAVYQASYAGTLRMFEGRNGTLFVDPNEQSAIDYRAHLSRQRQQARIDRQQGLGIYAPGSRHPVHRRSRASVQPSDDEEEGEDVYSRETLEQCIEETWDKVSDYVCKAFVPVACSQLAEQVRKARSVNAAAKIIQKYVDDELEEIATCVDHGKVYIIDGPEAAARWNDEHFDENGNPRDPQKSGTQGEPGAEGQANA